MIHSQYMSLPDAGETLLLSIKEYQHWILRNKQASPEQVLIKKCENLRPAL